MDAKTATQVLSKKEWKYGALQDLRNMMALPATKVFRTGAELVSGLKSHARLALA